ncbi:hypothetical protein GXP67_26960 [Rhodocytophaga rosea]|uniref:Linalool dehydratase/isomerase domain-containing protein n=1 Tax=Rhodocytophaga rosea TaxID=2704465 RepID=A0A6C0GPP7_9BACT|nr:hypothetical protein [Rhodocytophaga rosea]QHT70026.1 hypothetical protein GXP67_26960 [Rhodocytophaga rosea]
MRYIYLVILIFFSALLLHINWKLLPSSDYVSDTDDIILQLNFLEDQLKNHEVGIQMQQLFPEGFVFVYALYGLSWCELAIANAHSNDSLHTRAIQEALYAFDQISSKQAQERFDPHLFPENGIFYSGWNNYLLSKILLADTSFANYPSYRNRFKQQCKYIEEAMNSTESPFLESYQDQAWPADMFVAVASLRNHDRVFTPAYKVLLQNWSEKVQEALDSQSPMIPHKVDAITGTSIESPRGGSMALMLRMLVEIDPAFASRQYALFKSSFISTALTLPCVREYPNGSFGIGDVDSGPVILGVGFPATLVSIGCMPMFGDQDLSAKLYAAVHAFGFERITRNQKSYLLGSLPMADAFIAWSRTSALTHFTEGTSNYTQIWAWPFHLLSFVCLLIVWLFYFRKSLVRQFYKNKAD